MFPVDIVSNLHIADKDDTLSVSVTQIYIQDVYGYENHPGRYILINKDMGGKIQAELENIALIWFGWYRLYREVLGTLLGVNRNEEALLLAEASLKVGDPRTVMFT